MATWNKIQQPRDNGEMVEMQCPEIISASRSTDIPAFYCNWFFNRLERGYSAWTNPFNGVKSYVSYRNTRFIVFWSKNPRPLLEHIDQLRTHKIDCYIQYTLNDYETEGLEKAVPPLQERIKTFKALVNRLGKGRVVWRFDPMILTDTIDIPQLLSKVEFIGDQLKGYTEKLVFSYADIATYKKVQANLINNNIAYKEWTEDDMHRFAEGLSQLNKKWNYTLATCGEKITLEHFGIKKNHCIDDRLIVRLAYKDKLLMKFLNVKFFPMPSPSLYGETEPIPQDAIIIPNGTYAIIGNNKDKGQRVFCGCIKSKDIGEYNTCVHMCEYCYANTSKASANHNYRQHKENPFSETITGK